MEISVKMSVNPFYCFCPKGCHGEGGGGGGGGYVDFSVRGGSVGSNSHRGSGSGANVAASSRPYNDNSGMFL